VFSIYLQQNPMTTFRVGLFFGMFSILVIVAVVAGMCIIITVFV